MKTRSKLIVALSSLLAVTAGAAATSTFAWFTTTRTASVNFTSAKAYDKSGKLSITYDAVTNGSVEGNSQASNIVNLTGGTSGNVTDISGDGRTFYRPTWIPGKDGTKASAIPTVVNSTDSHYYIQFGVTLTNSATTGNPDLTVYLDAASYVKAHTAGTAIDVNAAKATRVAIYTVAAAGVLASTDTLTTLWQNDTTDSTYQYLTTYAATGAYDVPSTATEKASLATLAAANIHAGAFTEVTKGFTPGTMQTIGTIAATKSISLVVSIWLEGTLSTCVNTPEANTVVGGAVDTNLAFAAL